MDELNRPTTGSRFRVSGCRATLAAFVLVLTTHGTLLAWQAWRNSPTVDEPAHLVAGLSHWKFGRFDLYRVNPPLVRLIASLPMLLVDPKTDWSGFTEAPYSRPEFSIGTAFANANGFETFWHFTIARWACIPFSLLGGCFCFRWARDIYGGAAGIMALLMWCFCPNILGNGTLITPDVPAAAFGVMASYYYWRWLSVGGFLRNRQDVDPVLSSRHLPQDTGWFRALLAGLTLGLAELTKSTWIILVALWPLIWLIGKCRQYFSTVKNPKSQIRNPRCIGLWRDPNFAQLTAILLIAAYILNLGYGFENSFQRLDKFSFISRALGGNDAHETPGNRFANTWLGTLPVPFPANYLVGLDVQRYDFEVGKWSFLRGEQKMGGWWYYYLYAMAVKMPLGTLFLIALTLVLSGARITLAMRTRIDGALGCASRLNEHDHRSSMLDSLTLLAPAIALLFVVSSQTGFNRYLRYVVPAFPFLFIWTSQVARLLNAQSTAGDQFSSNRCPPTARQSLSFRSTVQQQLSSIVVVLSLLASIVSSLAVFPHSLSYFNELVGGPENGPAHLLDANVDWGQDLLELKRWYDTHSEARPLHMAYFGRVAPRTAGIEFDPIPRSVSPVLSKEAPVGVASRLASFRAPAWFAISINELCGYKHDGHEGDGYAWLKAEKSVARAGYSIRVYRTP